VEREPTLENSFIDIYPIVLAVQELCLSIYQFFTISALYKSRFNNSLRMLIK